MKKAFLLFAVLAFVSIAFAGCSHFIGKTAASRSTTLYHRRYWARS